jgi:aldehyde dehydrogenase (NAD+)
MSAPVTGESRMLIGGKLVHASDGGVFDNINPATEEVLGQCSDASAADMDQAIAAARQAFDETGWSRDRELRRRCLEQLQQALEDDLDDMRAELVAEAGAPVMTTHMAQVDWPLADALRYPAK